MKKNIFGWALLCNIALLPCHALAADVQSENLEFVSYPYVEGEFIWEIQNDSTFDSDDPDAELNDLFAYLELAVSLVVNHNFQINLAAIMEAVQDPGPRDDRFFDDHGLYIGTLNAQFNLSEDTNILLGKYGPGFGTAWDVTPGIYGSSFAEDYELSEYIGIGLTHSFNTERFGNVTLGVNAFHMDTTALSDSTITKRGRTRLSDGGAGNTEKLNNYSITLDGNELPEMDGFSWHLAYRHLSAGIGDIADETGIAAGFIQETELSDGKTAAFNFEFADLSNAGGSADDIQFVTAGISVVDGPWHLDLSGTFRSTNMAVGPNVNDELFQVSLGYVDDNDIDWNVGYKFSEEGGLDSHTIGLLITKSIEFSTR